MTKSSLIVTTPEDWDVIPTGEEFYDGSPLLIFGWNIIWWVPAEYINNVSNLEVKNNFSKIKGNTSHLCSLNHYLWVELGKPEYHINRTWTEGRGNVDHWRFEITMDSESLVLLKMIA